MDIELSIVEQPSEIHRLDVEGEDDAEADLDPSPPLLYDPEPQSQPDGDKGGERNSSLLRYRNKGIKSHFTLNAPCSNVNIHNKSTFVFSSNKKQFVLEEITSSETGELKEIVARQTKVGSFGLSILQGINCLISALTIGFFFVFCIQVILYLFLGLAIEGGLTSSQEYDYMAFTATILAIPIFIYSMASAMAMGVSFVVDAASGNEMVRSICGWENVYVEWVVFLIYVVVPLLTGSIGLWVGSDKWWDYAASIWILGVFLFFVAYCWMVTYSEVRGCLELMRWHPKLIHKKIDRKLAIDEQGLFSWDVIKRAIMIRQKQRFGCNVEVSYVSESCGVNPNESYEEKKLKYADTFEETKTLFDKMVLRIADTGYFFERLEDPKPLYMIEDIVQSAPILTAESWSLAKIYCLGSKAHSISVLRGDHALKRSQIYSTLLCSCVGLFLAVIFVASFLMWMELTSSGTAVIVASIGVLLCSISSLKASYKTFQTYRDLVKEDEMTNSKKISASMYRVNENIRIARPTPKVRMVLFFIEFVLFYLFPLIGLFVAGNYRIAFTFFLFASFSGVRQYFNVANCMAELGSLDGMETDEVSDARIWAEKHATSAIVKKISQGKRRDAWIVIFSVFVFLFLTVFLGAVGLGVDEGSAADFAPLPDFEYKENEFMPYPTCRLGKGISTPGDPASALTDFVFLSYLAYIKPNQTQPLLDSWFGEGNAYDLQDIVDSFKQRFVGELGSPTSVKYKLIHFPQRDMSIVAIRGTSNGWDALSDAQLWSAAALAQYVRGLLPAGAMWTPVLRHIISAVSVAESMQLEEVAYYKETTAFVKELKKLNKTMTNNIQITGHSLGGGLAMISGAQSKTGAVAVSGPNNILSRDTFVPKISLEDIDNMMFNIVPDRDPVPRFDDLGRLYQRVKCRAPMNNPLDCHSVGRTLCEVLFECGSHSRPVYCACVKDYGYDYPIPNGLGNRTFEEACGIEEEK